MSTVTQKRSPQIWLKEVALFLTMIGGVVFLFWVVRGVTSEPTWNDAEWYLVTSGPISDVKAESIMPYGDDRKNCEYYAGQIQQGAINGATSKCMTGKDVKALKPALAVTKR